MTGLEMLNEKLNALRAFLIKNSINATTISSLKTKLDEIPFFTSPIFEDIQFPQIQRVTINRNLFEGKNERIHDITFLKYPPSALVKKYGRANNLGQSILYAAFNYMTALKEMKPKVGDLITVSTWSLLDGANLTVSPVFKITTKDNLSHNELSLKFSLGYSNSQKQHPKEVAEQLDGLVQFMAECFAKNVEYGNSHDYFMSAYYADKIFQELDNGSVEAIVYPSVAEKLGFSNIAIRPEVFDKKYILKGVEESIVVATPIENKTGYALEGTGYAVKFDLNSNKILWK